MRKTIKFYEALLAFLTRDPKEDIVAADKMKARLIALAKEGQVSWVFSEKDLDQMDGANLWMNDETSFKLNFMMCAFKDLSTLRHPKAARIFGSLESIIYETLKPEFIWASKIIPKTCGQQTLLLHISSQEVWKMLRRMESREIKEIFDDDKLCRGIALERDLNGSVICSSEFL